MHFLPEKFFSNFGWLFSSSFGAHLVSLASLVFLARILTPHDFGIVSAVTIVVSFLRIFSEVGVAQALVVVEELSQKVIATANSIALIFGLFLVLVGRLVSESVGLFFENVEVERSVNIALFAIPVMGLNFVSYAVLQKQSKFRHIAYVNFAATFIAHFLVAIPYALYFKDHIALIAALLIQPIIVCTIIFFIEPKCRCIGIDKSSAKSLLSFGLLHSGAQIINYVANQVDNVVVGKYLGINSLGLYGRIFQLTTMPAMLIGGVFDKILLPLMVQEEKRKEGLSRLFVPIFTWTNIFSALVAGFMTIFADHLIHLLLGGGWEDGVIAFQVLSAALIFRLNYRICDSIILAKRGVSGRLLRQFLFLIVVVVGCFFGRRYGINGVAAAVLAAVISNSFVMQKYCCQLAGMRLAPFISSSILAGVFVLFSFMTNQFLVVAFLDDSASRWNSIMFSAICYIVVIFLWGAVFRTFYGQRYHSLLLELKNRSSS